MMYFKILIPRERISILKSLLMPLLAGIIIDSFFIV